MSILVIPEEWRGVIGMPCYEVSNLGRIRSIDRVYERPHPRNPSLIQRRRLLGRVLKPNLTTNGYLQLSSTRHGTRSIHRAVVESFIFKGDIPDGLIVCHKDGNKTNNVLANLYAGTYIDNRNDAIEHGTLCLRPQAKLTWDDVCDIRASSLSTLDLSDKYRVSRSCIDMVKRHATWRQE